MKQLSKVTKSGYLAINARAFGVLWNRKGGIFRFGGIYEDGIAVELGLVLKSFLKFLAFLFALNL